MKSKIWYWVQHINNMNLSQIGAKIAKMESSRKCINYMKRLVRVLLDMYISVLKNLIRSGMP